jgi:hypothetical protein
VKDCDPATGLPDSDEGYDDEYRVSYTEDPAHKVVKDMCLAPQRNLGNKSFMDEFAM